MRASTLGAFAAGFACGTLVVGIAVWQRSPAVLADGAMPAADRVVLPAPVPVGPGAVPPPPHVPEPPTVRDTGGLHLAMPLDGVKASTLVDSFHDKRNGRSHEALDIPASRGAPVLAVAAGTVAKLFTSKQGGLTVYQFDNSQKYCFYYAHLDGYAPGIKEGATVGKGEVLGYAGTTGNAPKDTPHLHFAVFELGADKKWWNGKPVNPLPLFQ